MLIYVSSLSCYIYTNYGREGYMRLQESSYNHSHNGSRVKVVTSVAELAIGNAERFTTLDHTGLNLLRDVIFFAEN